MKNLWVEAYRPKTVEGYVFKDESQRKQVMSWIKDRSIPHLLFSGNAGVGKCLRGSELIDIEIDETTLNPEQKEALQQYKIL